MKTNIRLFLVLMMGIVSMMETPANAQITELTPGKSEAVGSTLTDIIFSVDPKTNRVNNFFIKEMNTELQLYELKKNCYRCNYYIGSLEGNFKFKGAKLIPDKLSVFTINTTKSLMPGETFFPGGKFPPGSQFSLAGIKTTVVANTKGIFKVKAN